MDHLTERQVSTIWGHYAQSGRRFIAENGMPVSVIYPGRTNDHRGGDICDAVLKMGGQTITGDIELHVNSNDWKGHCHNQDPSYNRVILHVVFHNTGGPFTVLENGTIIPILALEKTPPTNLISEPVPPSFPFRPCLEAVRRFGEVSVVQALKKAGTRRFLDKARTMKDRLISIEPGQVLYLGIMEALGYANNREPFRELAERVPLAYLEHVYSSAATDSQCFQYLYDFLLTRAGLISDNQDGERYHDFSCSSGYSWQLYRARPGNSPVVRLAAMARIIVRYRSSGLLDGLLDVVRNTPPGGECKYIERAVMVSSREIAGSASQRLPDGLSPLGTGRAREIIINMLLPFMWAYGKVQGKSALSRKALSFYCQCGKLTRNCIERHMANQLSLPANAVKNAVHQQGLLDIYNRFCIKGRCSKCGLGQLEVRDNVQIQD